MSKRSAEEEESNVPAKKTCAEIESKPEPSSSEDSGLGNGDEGKAPPGAPESVGAEEKKPEEAGPSGSSPAAAPVPDLPDWRRTVSKGLREILVQKFVKAMLPIDDPKYFADPRYEMAVSFARKVENSAWMDAQSQEEYYRMIAQQIVDVPKYIKSHKEKILKNRALEKAAATAAAAGQRAEAGGEPGPSRLKIVAPKVESEKTNRAEDEPKPGPSGLGFSSETSTAPANGNCCGDPVEPASTPLKAAEASAVASSNAP